MRFPGSIARLSDAQLDIAAAPPNLNEHSLTDRETPPPTLNKGAREKTDPLEGLKVLDMTSAIAGPYASSIMGDFGAEVLRIESETKPCIMRGAGPFVDNEAGADNSLSYLTINAPKKSLAIDLRNPNQSK